MNKRKVKQVLARAAYIGSAGLTVWVLASFVDVNAHNLSDGQFASWNIFVGSVAEAEAETVTLTEAPTVEESQVQVVMAEQEENELLRQSIEEYQQRQEEEAIRINREEMQRLEEELTAWENRIQHVKEMSDIPDEYIDLAFEIAQKKNICPELVVAIIETESDGVAKLDGAAGEKGLMQVIPRFNEDVMEKLGVTDLYDPRQNIETGTETLLNLFEEYGDTAEVLMFYNMGYTGLDLYEQGIVSEYAQVIMDRSHELEVTE